jgi:antitoxin component YwqK of YwqJK toxin-antitoxin module
MKTETYKVEFTYHENGNKRSEKWYQNNQLHRLDGPAAQYWNEHGQKEMENWYENGKEINVKTTYHHPTSEEYQTWWYENGQKETEEW